MGSVEGSPYLFNTHQSEQETMEQTLMLADQGLIDPVENIKQDNIYLFHGLDDSIVPYQGL